MSAGQPTDPTVRRGTLEGVLDPPGPKAPLERYVPGVLAYVEGYSVGPGEEIAVKVSSSEPSLRAEIVRLKAPLVDRAPQASWETYADLGTIEGLTEQPLSPGSCLRVEPHEQLDPVRGAVFAGWVRPSLAGLPDPQTVLALVGGDGSWVLRLDALPGGTLAWRLRGADDDAVVRLEAVLEDHRWHRVVAAWSPQRDALELWCWTTADGAEPQRAAAPATAPAQAGTAGILFGAAPDPDGPWTREHFNGKLARLRWYADLPADALARLAEGDEDGAPAGALLAAWDLAANCGGTAVLDRGPLGLRTTTVNCPLRGVTGPHWSGAPETSFREEGHDYDAIWLHDDDVDDVGWPTTFTWRVPEDARSAAMAVRLSSATSERFVPFVVTPPADGAGERPPLLVVLPWFTYMVYGNDQLLHRGQVDRASAYANDPVRRFLREHPSLGYSPYDRHRDGTGICYASARRPILNLSPAYVEPVIGAARHFPADLYLLELLEQSGRPYDVVTDAEVDRLGLDALSPYACVVLGSHPEYPTGSMLDAYEAYVAQGGNIAYLGGNGLFIPVSLTEDRMTIERRYGDTPYMWMNGPGEYHHSLDGQRGAAWSELGRSPQPLLGVTTVGEGTGGPGRGYRRQPDLPPEAEFVFAGVTAEVIGEHGAAGGGAAGDELDGTIDEEPRPERAILLARADGFDPYYLGLKEPLQADMTLVLHEGGGRVFSVGSISWNAALATDGFANDVAQVTGNVLDEFSRRHA